MASNCLLAALSVLTTRNFSPKATSQRAKWRNPIDGDPPWYDIPALYPKEHLEMRQGARIILKSKEN
jgi:hypothetical protein